MDLMLDKVAEIHLVYFLCYVELCYAGFGSCVMYVYLIESFDIMCAAELFSDVQPFVQSALDGYNVSIFAYGQTHSGKTHTMVSLSLHAHTQCICS